MRVVISSKYKSFTPFFKTLPVLYENDGKTVFKDRNEVKLFHLYNHRLAVKSFKVPHIFNRIAYTFFRKSKAKRSYEYAIRLINKGIDTPAPISYITERKWGLFSHSFYISLFSNYPGVLRDLAYHPLEEVQKLVEDFAHFTAGMHNKKVLHSDYSPGNILYDKGDDEYVFCLIDINRVKFGSVSKKAGCYNLRRLWGSNETITHIARIYAEDRGFDAEECIRLALKYHRRFWKRYSRRHPDQKPYRVQ